MAVAAVVPVTMSWGARVGLEDFVRVGRGAETGETAADHVDPIAVGIDARFPPAGWNRGGRGPRVAFDVVHLIDIQWRTSSPAADGVYLIAQVACHKTGSRGWHGRLGRPSIILRVVDHDVVQELSTRTAPDNVNLASVLHRGCVRAGPWQRGHRAPAIRMDVVALHHIQRVSAAGAITAFATADDVDRVAPNRGCRGSAGRGHRSQSFPRIPRQMVPFDVVTHTPGTGARTAADNIEEVAMRSLSVGLLSAGRGRGRGSQAPGIPVDAIQPRQSLVPAHKAGEPRESVGADHHFSHASHGHSFRGTR